MLQEDRLWLADPKAIQYILHGQGPINQYERPYAVREQSPMVVDRGLSWAAGRLSFLSDAVLRPLILNLGDTHKRQRRAVAPAFGLAEAKALYPHFARCSIAVSHCPKPLLTSNFDVSSPVSSRTNFTKVSRAGNL